MSLDSSLLQLAIINSTMARRKRRKWKMAPYSGISKNMGLKYIMHWKVSWIFSQILLQGCSKNVAVCKCDSHCSTHFPITYAFGQTGDLTWSYSLGSGEILASSLSSFVTSGDLIAASKWRFWEDTSVLIGVHVALLNAFNKGRDPQTKPHINALKGVARILPVIK